MQSNQNISRRTTGSRDRASSVGRDGSATKRMLVQLFSEAPSPGKQLIGQFWNLNLASATNGLQDRQRMGKMTKKQSWCKGWGESGNRAASNQLKNYNTDYASCLHKSAFLRTNSNSMRKCNIITDSSCASNLMTCTNVQFAGKTGESLDFLKHERVTLSDIWHFNCSLKRLEVHNLLLA